jgi:hypothetical protein
MPQVDLFLDDCHVRLHKHTSPSRQLIKSERLLFDRKKSPPFRGPAANSNSKDCPATVDFDLAGADTHQSVVRVHPAR